MLEEQKEGKSSLPRLAEGFKARDMRLSEPDDFKRTLKEGKKARSECFELFFKENELDHSRFGVNIAKRLVGKSTERNKIKRTAREIFRKSKKCNMDIVLLLRRPSEKNKYKEEIEALFKKIET